MQRSDRGGHMLDALLSARPKLKVFRGRDTLHYFRLYDYNGEVLLTSQGVPEESQCVTNLDLAKTAVNDEKNFGRQTTSDSKFTYLLMSPSRQVLAVGAMYNNVRDCDDAIRTLKHAMAEAQRDDSA